MSGFKYTTIRAEVETSDDLEERIIKFAREEGVRMARARRQLVQKGLALVETKLPDMTKEEERTFRKNIEKLQSFIRSKKQAKGGEK